MTINLIVQYYKCDNVERQKEIDTCLQNNLQNNYLDMVHLLTEAQYDFTQFINNDKIKQTVIGERLTYEKAFLYANQYQNNDIWILSNADIYLDESLQYLLDARMDQVVFALTRHDVQPDGSIQLVHPQYAHGSQDVWIFKTPIHTDSMFTSFCLGIPGCDHRIAHELVQAGCMVLNPSLKIIARHLDLASGIDIDERTKGYVALMTEEGYKAGKAAPRPYQYFLYPSDRLEVAAHELYREQLSLHEELYSARNSIDERERWLGDKDEQITALHRLMATQLALKDAQLEDFKRKLAERDARIHALQNSLSWRITKPLRAIHEKLVPEKYKKPQKPSDNNYINNYFAQLLTRDRTEPILRRDVMVDIVLPVYNGFDVTKACIESVLENSENCRVIIIDDASSDERIPELLRSVAGIPGKNLHIICVRNEENLGFVRSVNKAFTLTKHHFVILNSDTEVPPGWLDRLFAPILQDNKVATVTPFSNSATICSFPEVFKDNPLYRGLDVSALDSYFNRYGSSEPIDIPTGVGFCMAINKQLTEMVGFFDEETFIRGYGEENDFCMRTAKTGYRNVLVPNLFVYHKHGESFGSSEKQELLAENYQKLVQKHPDYPMLVEAFVNADPVRDVRDALSLIIAAREGEKNKTIALIDFDLGGGANVYTTSLAQQLTDDGHRVVHLKYNLLRNCLNVECMDTETVKLSLPEQETAHIGRILSLLAVEFVMVSQLVSWPEPSKVMSDIKGSGIPYLIFMHDFFYICPNWYLLKHDCQFCNMPADKNICAQCLQQDELFNIPLIYEPRMRDVGAWRENVVSFLSGASRVVCFSDSTIALVRKAYPTIDNLELNEHFIPQQQLFQWRSRSFNAENTLTVAVIGCINFAKGGKLLEQLAASIEFAEMPVRLVVLGTMQPMPRAELLLKDKLIVHGDYSREELPGLLEHYGVSVILIPSIWPETFSYTTSEALLLGYPVLCFDIGAPAERVRRYGSGMVLEASTTDAMMTAFKAILARPTMIEEMSDRTRNYVPNTPEKHFATLVQIANLGSHGRQAA